MSYLFKLLIVFSILFPIFTFSQSGPPAPSAGIWAIIDTNYNVGTTTQGVTHAKLTLKNTSLTKYTGIQFRVFYDKVAFTNASVALIGSTTNLDLQYVTNAANGYITLTLVYTGPSSTYTIAQGETFDITFTHAPQAIFNNLTSITQLKWTGVQTFQTYASTQQGTDTTLGVYSYGGNFKFQTFKFHGSFKNVTGTPAKNLHLALEKKPFNGSTWTQQGTYVTDASGKFSILEPIDTTYWDVRLAIKGDTMGVGNVISTSDAQLINQWVLGNGTMTGFDFYTADVNTSYGTTITDAYGVFGRIAGRFTTWPNNTKDVKFFTTNEYTTINGSVNNYTSTIAGNTNFYYDILVGQPDSINYYVMVTGDANGTGYHMARITPIEVVIEPTPGIESQVYNVIDQSVQYDFPTNTIEVNVPRLSVDEGNLVNLPVKVLTNGNELNSLQFGLKCNDTILEFKGINSTSNVMKWLTYVNANDGEVDWGGYDVTNNENTLKNNDEVVTLQFLAKKPQSEWEVSPLYTTRKFAGNIYSKDLNLVPANGIIKVLKMKGSGKIIDENTMEVYPNPFEDEVMITFNVNEATDINLSVYDLQGRQLITILTGQVPEGQFSYSSNLGKLEPGMYIAKLYMENNKPIFKKIIKQN